MGNTVLKPQEEVEAATHRRNQDTWDFDMDLNERLSQRDENARGKCFDI